MNELTIIENSEPIKVQGIYYTANNSYYLIYTKGQQDGNNYVILHITKLARSVNQQDPQIPVGSLIGISIDSEEEWNRTKEDISKIIEDKKAGTNSYQYLDCSIINNLIVVSYKTFKLLPEVLNNVFGTKFSALISSNSNEIVDYKSKYEEIKQINEDLTNQINQLKQTIEQVRQIIQ